MPHRLFLSPAGMSQRVLQKAQMGHPSLKVDTEFRANCLPSCEDLGRGPPLAERAGRWAPLLPSTVAETPAGEPLPAFPEPSGLTRVCRPLPQRAPAASNLQSKPPIDFFRHGKRREGVFFFKRPQPSFNRRLGWAGAGREAGAVGGAPPTHTHKDTCLQISGYSEGGK